MDAAKQKEKEPAYINMIAGGISGAASKTVTAPLARLTILYQVQSFNKSIHSRPPDLFTQALPVRTPSPPSGVSGNSSGGQQARTAHPRATPHPYLCRPPPPPHHPSLTQAMRNLVATEGVAALWRGNLATIIHRLPYSATNFAVFEAANKGLVPHMQSDIGRRLTAGATSGLVACIVAYPLDLVRTRLSAQRGGAAQNPHQIPPLAYNLPVRQGGGSSTGSSTGSSSSSSSSSSSRSSSSRSSNRPGMAGSHPAASSPSSIINLGWNQHQHQQPRVTPHITLYPSGNQSPCIAQPCHTSSATPCTPQQPLQQAQVLHQTAAHLQPSLLTGHCHPHMSQPPLQLATSQNPALRTPLGHPRHHHWQHQQHQPQLHTQRLPWQMQGHQHCLKHLHQTHTSSHLCSPTTSLSRLYLTTPCPPSPAAPAVLSLHSSNAFLSSSAMHFANNPVTATPRATMSTASAIPSPHVTAATPTPHYRGIVHALTHIVQQEGVLGLYRGLGATLLQVTPSLALNFTLYDSFKDVWLKHLAAQSAEKGAWITHITPWSQHNGGSTGSSSSAEAGNSSSSRVSGDTAPQSLNSSCDDADTSKQSSSTGPSEAVAPHMTTGSSLVCGAAAGFCSSTLTFPLDLIRRRVQVSHRHSAAPHASATSEYLAVWRQVYMANGLRGFYAGIMTEYAKVLPGMAIAFTVYEGTKELLKKVVLE